MQFLAIEDADHFDVLGPANRVIAELLVPASEDDRIRLTVADIEEALAAQRIVNREAADLERLAELRAAGVALGKTRTVRFSVFARDEDRLAALAKDAGEQRFKTIPIARRTDADGDPFWVLVLTRRLELRDLDAVFDASSSVDELTELHDAYYDGFSVR